MGTELYIFAPLDDEKDKFRENVNVIIQDLTGKNIDLPKYKAISEPQIGDYFSDAKIIESAIVHTEKNDFYKIVYTMSQGIFKLKVCSYCFIKDEKAYLVSFGAEADKFDGYKVISERVLNSFTLTK